MWSRNLVLKDEWSGKKIAAIIDCKLCWRCHIRLFWKFTFSRFKIVAETLLNYQKIEITSTQKRSVKKHEIQLQSINQEIPNLYNTWNLNAHFHIKFHKIENNCLSKSFPIFFVKQKVNANKEIPIATIIINH